MSGDIIDSTWLGGSAGWNEPSQWNTNPYYPNNGNPPEDVYNAWISSGTATLNGDITILQFDLGGATLTGGYSLSVSGMSWSSGTMSDAGTTTLRSGGTSTLSGTTSRTLDTRTLNNQGTVTVTGTGAFYIDEGAIINNSGTLNVTTDADFARSSGANGTFDNSGVFRKSAGTDVTGVTGGTVFNNSGTVDVKTGSLLFENGYIQTAGTTHLDSGTTLTSSLALDLQGGNLTGSGTVVANINASGANIAPGSSPGTLTVNGSLSLGILASLIFELGGNIQGSEYDFLDVNGLLTLGGTLNVSFVNDFHSSVQQSDHFILASANSAISGSLANVLNGERLYTTDGYGSFLVNYGRGAARKIWS